jgi:hypothetical protein
MGRGFAGSQPLAPVIRCTGARQVRSAPLTHRMLAATRILRSVFGPVSAAFRSLTEIVTLAQNIAGLSTVDAQVASVPEPSTLLSLGSGVARLDTVGYGCLATRPKETRYVSTPAAADAINKRLPWKNQSRKSCFFSPCAPE